MNAHLELSEADRVEFIARRLYIASHPSTPRPAWSELSEDGRRWWAYMAHTADLAMRELS